MRGQLIRYIDLLFAGAPEAVDIKQEILQNTLDRYDDLIAQGKAPEAAYRLAISGIGDINEILGGTPRPAATNRPQAQFQTQPEAPDAGWKKAVRAAAISLYIICVVPLFILQNEIGLCLLLVIVAIATAMIVIASKGKSGEPAQTQEQTTSPQHELRKSVKTMIWAVGLAVYFILSFATMAWYITWVIFPITAAVQGLVIACMDLKEAA